MHLASRRSRALADYWDELAGAREPADLFAACNEYWARFLQDYQAAGGGAVASLMRSAAMPAAPRADWTRVGQNAPPS